MKKVVVNGDEFKESIINVKVGEIYVKYNYEYISIEGYVNYIIIQKNFGIIKITGNINIIIIKSNLGDIRINGENLDIIVENNSSNLCIYGHSNHIIVNKGNVSCHGYYGIVKYSKKAVVTTYGEFNRVLE